MDFVLPSFHRLEEAIDFEKIDGDEVLAKRVDKSEREFDELDTLPSPRLFKSHLPAHLLPTELWTAQAKIIYIHRDVKDIAVSMYHMMGNHPAIQFKPNKSDIFASIYRHGIHSGPFYHHIHSFHQLRHLNNLLIVSYEDLLTNTFECVKRISEFLECSYSDEQLQQLVRHVSFGKMREKIVFGPEILTDSDYK